MLEEALSNSDESSSESEGDDTNDDEIDGLLDDLLDDLTADDPPIDDSDNATEPAEPTTSSNEIDNTSKATEPSTSSNIAVDKKNSSDEAQIKGQAKIPTPYLFFKKSKSNSNECVEPKKALSEMQQIPALDEKKIEFSLSPIQDESSYIKLSDDCEFDESDSLSGSDLSEDCTSGLLDKTPERGSRKRPIKSSSLALSQRIIRNYKRRAMMKSSPMKNLGTPRKMKLPKELSSDDDDDDDGNESDENVLVIDERPGHPLEAAEAVLPISIDKTLGRCGTTVRKVLIPKAPQKFDELAIGEPQVNKPAKSVFDPLKSPPTKVTYFPHVEANQKLKIMKYHHGLRRVMPALQKPDLFIPVPRQLKSQTRSVDKLLKKLPSFEFRKSESSETDKTPKDDGPSTSTSTSSDTKSLVPASSTSTSTSPSTSSKSKVRLWRLSNGSYSLDGKVLPPESFPKAIIYPTLAPKKKLPSEMSIKYPVNLEVARVKTSKEQLQPAVPETTTGRKRVLSVDPSAEALLRSHELQAIRVTHSPSTAERNKTPEPVKYIIPQGMLASASDKVQHIQEPSSSEGSPQHENDNDQFMVENDDDKKPQQTAGNKSRRKATIIPKEDDDEMSFEEPPFEMPPRPQANVDLIANLATYRVLVRNLLEKLNVPQIDFNGADGDEYINIYKIYRNGT